MTDTMTRTSTRRHETEWQRFKRLIIRRLKKILKQNIAWIIFIGLPLIGVIIGIFIGVKATTYAQSTKINDYGRQMVYTTYTVKSGDTIWGIAQDLAALNPEFNDIRQYVSVIKNTNNMSTDEIKSGQNLIIPYYISPNGIANYDEIYSKYGIEDNERGF